MSPIRPEVAALFARWREVLGAVALGLAGLWVFGFGGYFFQAIGVGLVLVGASAVVVAVRRLRFHAEVAAPGLVQVDEGQITYLAPQDGGFVALSELTALDLVFDAQGGRLWRLTQMGLPAVTIPAAAQGADALFDSFVSLPGARPGHILAALDRTPDQGPVTVWRRARPPALT